MNVQLSDMRPTLYCGPPEAIAECLRERDLYEWSSSDHELRHMIFPLLQLKLQSNVEDLPLSELYSLKQSFQSKKAEIEDYLSVEITEEITWENIEEIYPYDIPEWQMFFSNDGFDPSDLPPTDMVELLLMARERNKEVYLVDHADCTVSCIRTHHVGRRAKSSFFENADSFWGIHACGTSEGELPSFIMGEELHKAWADIFEQIYESCGSYDRWNKGELGEYFSLPSDQQIN